MVTALVVNYIKVTGKWFLRTKSPMNIKDLYVHIDAYTWLLSLEGQMW